MLILKKIRRFLKMTKFERIKKYYDDGLWNIDRVSDAVVKGFITEEEFELITGQPYVEK